ncbi:hypothetical protein [Mycobacterium sp. shizuoka-1]|uniref:hypothetical protein n=1 Tax=Mycobacterium sp. shizuoka-1 TaxID=2039281 RepID=UPI0018EE23AE|nr:hypothetical protein [Mycobacterium sp. shizuoka-1]
MGLIEDLLPARMGKRRRLFQDARSMVEGIISGIGAGSPGVMRWKATTSLDD